VHHYALQILLPLAAPSVRARDSGSTPVAWANESLLRIVSGCAVNRPTERSGRSARYSRAATILVGFDLPCAITIWHYGSTFGRPLSIGNTRLTLRPVVCGTQC
jgi:hypothetical protein